MFTLYLTPTNARSGDYKMTTQYTPTEKLHTCQACTLANAMKQCHACQFYTKETAMQTAYTKLLTRYYSRHQASITAHRLVNRLARRMVKYYSLAEVQTAINTARAANGRETLTK